MNSNETYEKDHHVVNKYAAGIIRIINLSNGYERSVVDEAKQRS